MASFPEKVWDGITAARPDLRVTQPPTYGDWLAMLAELQAIQRYILSLSDNMATMPNIKETIEDMVLRIEDLNKELSELDPPADLHKEMAEVRKELDDLDIRHEHTQLKNGVKRLFLRTKVLETSYKDFKAEVQRQLQILTNNVHNQFTKVARSMVKRQDELQEQIRELQDVLERPDLD